MKKYILSVASLAVVAMLPGGCTKDFDAKIYGILTAQNFPQTEEDYESYLMTCYIPYTINWEYFWVEGGIKQHNFYVTEGGIQRMFDSPTDLCAPTVVGGPGGAWRYITQGQFGQLENVGRATGETPTHFEKIRDVSRFTEIIATLENAPADILGDAKKKEFVAEARLLRGIMMYYMLHIYGPVPVILDPALVGDIEAEKKLVRPTLTEMVENITADLEYAVANIPETQPQVGRYNRDYTRFFLMRHYLNEGAHMAGYYQKAYDIFSTFTGSYSLFTSGQNPYAEQFMIANKFNSEVIMAVPCSDTADGSAKTGNFNPFSWYVIPGQAAREDDQGNPTPFALQGGGWNHYLNFDPVYYETFDDDDMRKETVLTSYYDRRYGWITKAELGVRWSGYIINKFPIETATAYQGTDFPLARWADALLLNAEADVRLNNAVSQAAIDKVNEVRARAGMDALPASATASKEAFLDALLVERGHEMMWEGTRKIDLIRFNKYYTVMSEYGRPPSSQYFPIPQYAVQQAEDAGYELTHYFTRPDYDGPQRNGD